MSRSRSLFGAHVSASARAGVPVTQTSPEGGIRTLCNLFRNAAFRPGMAVPKDSGIHDYAARFQCSHATAETSWPTSGLPSIIKNCKKPAFVGSVGGSKRTLSSTASNKHEPSGKAKVAADQGQAKYERSKDVPDLSKMVRFNAMASTFIGLCLIYLLDE